ncbi:MAG: hypothetical protein F6J87_12655 [Spirulina sp. SIO3F2]|nr:hypothetical protein [Spirulina sp. SIO3F2]
MQRRTWANRIGILGIVSAIALSACGPSKVEECTEILNAWEATRRQKTLGTYTRELVLQHATLDEQLAGELEAMPIRNAKLKEHLATLIAGIRKGAEANRAYAEWVGPEGTVSIRVGDTAREQAWQQVQSQQRQANNQTQLGYGQIMSFCSI